MDLTSICRDTVNLLQETLAPENCSAMILSGSGGLLLVAARGAFDDDASIFEPAAQNELFAADEGIAALAVKSRLPIRVDCVQDDARFVMRKDAAVQPVSLLSVPLLARGQPVGVINLSDSMEGAFDSTRKNISAHHQCRGHGH